MCGFAGLLRWDGLEAEDTARVAAAARVLAHRGPDSDGFWNDRQVTLGFRRLRIIDLSPAGEQPMTNEDGSLRLVFNGEIYNYRELRTDLLARGHVFKSQSDTEVLLHLFEEYGEDMLPRLRGMFAFALWDARARKLFMARDPLGVKPLYFAERGGMLAFASEAKALFALGVEREIDCVALDEALTWRYVPAPRSGFKDVEKLPPGHCAWAANGALEYKRWWRASLRKPADGIRADAAGEALERVGAAVQRRLAADVPLGFWLSGGIDSGLVLAQAGGGARALCAGFAQPQYDERALARETAEHCRASLESFEVPADIFKLLPAVVWHADEPFFDSSALPVYALAQRTKAHATVALGGDGGDEAFAGYQRYAGLQQLARYKKVPRMLRAAALALARRRHPAASRGGWDRMLRWLEKCRLMEASGHHPYVAAMELFSSEQRAAIDGERLLEANEGCDAREHLDNELLRARKTFETFEAESGKNSREWQNAAGVLQLADLETYLPGDLLLKADRMAMAHGVELRSPFLDIELLEWSLALPETLRSSKTRTKPLLREAARRVLPPRVAAGGKRGFGVPLDDWFRGPLCKTALELFESSVCVKEGVFRPRFWETLWREHAAGKAQHGERLYALLTAEVWLRTFFMGKLSIKTPADLA